MCKVLVVDDDPDFVEIARTVLQHAGHEVITASNGSQAWEKVQSEQPDVVLLDIMMSAVLDGVDLAHRIGETPTLKRTHVVMVTSIMDTEHSALFPTDEYIPADSWLTKPVQPKTLLATVNKLAGAPAA